MLVKDIPYSYNNKEYVLWMWKGDYWNLGTGSEIGLYQQSAECGEVMNNDKIC